MPQGDSRAGCRGEGCGRLHATRPRWRELGLALEPPASFRVSGQFRIENKGNTAGHRSDHDLVALVTAVTKGKGLLPAGGREEAKPRIFECALYASTRYPYWHFSCRTSRSDDCTA